MRNSEKQTEARDILWQVMDSAGLDAPDSAVWLAIGRMAEQFGARSSGRGLSQSGEAHTRGTDAGFELRFSGKKAIAAMQNDDQRYRFADSTSVCLWKRSPREF